jgi:hypothetical protein
MYGDPAMTDRLKMCADCRAVAQSESTLDPYAGPPRPFPRHSDEHLAREDLPPDPKKRN